jgi:hypothetical protein
MSPDHGKPGNGLLLFFRVDDFDQALQRARSLVSRLEEEPHLLHKRGPVLASSALSPNTAFVQPFLPAS